MSIAIQRREPTFVPDSCGALLHRRQLILPYAMSDKAAVIAPAALDDLLGALRN